MLTMAAKLMLAAVFLLQVAVVALPQTAAAATYYVGDSLGWTVPFDPNSYSAWASSKTFHVGDILVFNFIAGLHDVMEVTKAGFDSCSSTDPISSERTGPARITLSTAGTHHFICSIPGHCGYDQKLSVTVRPPPSTPPAAAPSPSINPKTPMSPPLHSAHPLVLPPPTATSPPPPPNSGNSLRGFSLFSTVGFVIFVALL